MRVCVVSSFFTEVKQRKKEKAKRRDCTPEAYARVYSGLSLQRAFYKCTQEHEAGIRKRKKKKIETQEAASIQILDNLRSGSRACCSRARARKKLGYSPASTRAVAPTCLLLRLLLAYSRALG